MGKRFLKTQPTLSNANAGNDNEAQSLGVLVVGDWLVDEHWLVGKHRAFSSSRTGQEHFRALHRQTCSVRSLCGAGQVATILHQATAGERRPFQVNGIGIWHAADEPTLQRMLDPKFNVGRTPHLLASDEYSAGVPEFLEDTKLYNLVPQQLGVAAGTTRIIRIYTHRGDKLELVQRIDWALPLTEADITRIRKGIPTALESLRRSGRSISHIFVKDLLKGAISRELIIWLRHTFRNASWYVSSKAWNPSWFSELPKHHVKLVLVPQQAAHRAISTGEISSSSWITSGGVPSQDAIRVIDGIASEFTGAKIVVLPEGMKVLARDANNGYVLPTPGVADTLPFTPMASVFYPALGAQMIATTLDFLTTLKKAIAFTEIWEKAEAQRTVIDSWTPQPEQMLLLDNSEPPADRSSWLTPNWAGLTAEWKQAFANIGVVKVRDKNRKQKEQFQLWRGMTDIHGYVTCIPSKRRHVLTLLREGLSLKNARSDERRHTSFFIVDRPGSGKSFMIDCLAFTLKMQCLKFNIASLSSKDGLADCFKKLSAEQSKDPETTLMAFFDEMNAKPNGQNVYDIFLEPLEDGRYLDNGKTFHLKPCLWIFAGTSGPMSATDEEHPSNKALDFETRLTHPVMYLGSAEGPHVKARTSEERDLTALREVEQIYLGVATIRQEFTDVTKISKKVLEAFRLLDPEKVGPRDIRRFVRSFEYIQYGRVMGNNLPNRWNEQMEVNDQLFGRWKDEQDGEHLLVEIWSRPE